MLWQQIEVAMTSWLPFLPIVIKTVPHLVGQVQGVVLEMIYEGSRPELTAPALPKMLQNN